MSVFPGTQMPSKEGKSCRLSGFLLTGTAHLSFPCWTSSQATVLCSENSVDFIIPSTFPLVTKALCSLNVIADGEMKHLGLFQRVPSVPRAGYQVAFMIHWEDTASGQILLLVFI